MFNWVMQFSQSTLSDFEELRRGGSEWIGRIVYFWCQCCAAGFDDPACRLLVQVATWGAGLLTIRLHELRRSSLVITSQPVRWAKVSANFRARRAIVDSLPSD